MRINLAIFPGAWLMPENMVINTESTVGYNNQLKQATHGMKLGINGGINTEIKKAAQLPMDGGPSKVNPPNSHPSNPIHKAATAKTLTAEPRRANSTNRSKTRPGGPRSKQKSSYSWRCRTCWFGGLVIALTPLFYVSPHQKGYDGQN